MVKTHEELQEALDKLGKIDIEVGESRGYKLYEDIKTIYGSTFNLLQTLIDRATPKKPIYVDEEFGGGDREMTWIKIPTCPTCHGNIYLHACCQDNDCRQAIDWEKENK